MTDCSIKEEQEDQFSLSDELNLQLMRISEYGKIKELKIFLEKYTPNKFEIDLAIRKCFYRFRNNNDYCETIKELFKYADLNYCNPTCNNSNLLMSICDKTNSFFFDLIFGQKYKNNFEKNKANKINNKNNIKDNNSYVDINLYHVDNNNYNIFHYLFKEIEMNLVNEINEAITRIMNYKGNYNNKIYSLEKKKALFTQPNNEGITPIIMILIKGNVKVLSFVFKYIDYQKYIIPSNNNNLIHCAIQGQDIKCVKKILSYCNSIEELKFKNKEGYTPLIYAKKYELNFIEKIIEEVEKNFDNKEYKSVILSIKIGNIYDILAKYMVIRNNCYIDSNIDGIQNIIKRDYNSIIYNIKKYELDNFIIDNKYFNMSCQWNILFIKTQMNQLLDYINREKNKNKMMNQIKQFSSFFHQDFNSNENNDFYINDIIIYNKIIFYYKLGDYSSFLETINYYFKNIYKKDDNEYNYIKYITYVNISFILIEYFIFDNDKILSENLITAIKEYLDTNKEYQFKYEANETIIKYLNSNEIFNPFNSTLEDAYCYLSLMQAFHSIKFKTPDYSFTSSEEIKLDKVKSRIKKYLEEFNFRYKNCEYKEELVNLNRIKGFATINKCYYYYLTNILNKSLNNIYLIKESLYYSNEYKIFYFNSLGIIYLKQKKYNLSEYLFKTGLVLFKTVAINNSGEDKLFYNIEYAIKMKYNLGLALFYNKKYFEAYFLFQEIQNNNIIKNNPFFWYRYGLTALNLYLNALKESNKEKEKEKKIKEDEKIIQINKFPSGESSNDNIKESSDDIEKENDELFIEFQKEFENEDNYNVYFDINNLNKVQNNKKIFIPFNSINKAQMANSGISIKLDSDKNIKEYLITSIKCFKKPILLYKSKPYVIKRDTKINENIESIINFFKIDNKNIQKRTDSCCNFNDLNISNISLFISSYLNLLFSLTLNEKYNEVLLLIKVFPPNLLNQNNIKTKLDYFKLNSLINIRKYKEVEEIIKKNKEKESENESDINYTTYEFDCLNKNNCELEKKMNHKLYLLLAKTFLNCGLKKYDKAEKNLMKIINMNYEKKSNISNYYTQLMVYILSLQNKKKQTINLLKYRWNEFQKKGKKPSIKYKNNDKNG